MRTISFLWVLSFGVCTSIDASNSEVSFVPLKKQPDVYILNPDNFEDYINEVACINSHLIHATSFMLPRFYFAFHTALLFSDSDQCHEDDAEGDGQGVDHCMWMVLFHEVYLFPVIPPGTSLTLCFVRQDRPRLKLLSVFEEAAVLRKNSECRPY